MIQEKVEIMVPLNYISNCWRNLEMFLIDCENNLDLNWSKNCIIVVTDVQDQVITFSVTDRKRYVLVVTQSTQDNAKLLDQLKSSFKKTINWNKYQSKISKRKTKSIF